MPKPPVPPKYVNGKDMSDNSENEVGLMCGTVCGDDSYGSSD